jgi:glycosyltransferase involved in cell wall biosynthesis
MPVPADSGKVVAIAKDSSGAETRKEVRAGASATIACRPREPCRRDVSQSYSAARPVLSQPADPAVRIVFDSQIFCRQRFGGISRYFASLASALALLPGARVRIVAPLHINDFAAHLPPELVVGRRVQALGKATIPLALLSAALGELIQYGFSPGIVHETYYYPQPRTPRSARRVTTIHDLGYHRYPEQFRANHTIPRWMVRALRRADHVICVSEHPRRDFLELFDFPPDRVSVTHLGYGSLLGLPLEPDPVAARARFSVGGRPYILYVGSRASYKNFGALLRAFASSSPLRDSFAVVAFGGGEFTSAERTQLEKLGLVGRVRQVSGSDDLLGSCYRHAAVLAYPSLYEGFGIPPLEAMSLDCPVVCSNTTSIPEVVGDAAVTFDPLDEMAIRTALESVLGSESLRTRLIERGRRRKQLFSWARCARETLEIYRKTAAA